MALIAIGGWVIVVIPPIHRIGSRKDMRVLPVKSYRLANPAFSCNPPLFCRGPTEGAVAAV
jgi:hypothetical protein